MMNRISKQELIIGFLSTCIFGTIWLPILTSMLWGLGGTVKKSIRRFGVPIAVLLFTHNPLSLCGIFPLFLGDGFPDHRESTKDEGSWLGRQVEKILPDEYVGGLTTKLIPVLLLQIVWLLIIGGRA
jgi:hypothetical protein